VYKRGPRENLLMGVDSNPVSLILSLWTTFYFLVECMRAQTFNSCKRVGVKIHI
jgi:hypothetical protein